MADVTASAPARAQARARALAADPSPAGASTRAEPALAAATDARTRRALLRDRQRLAAEIARAALHGAVVEACRPHPEGGVQAHPLDVVEALLREAAARMAGAAARDALAAGTNPASHY